MNFEKNNTPESERIELEAAEWLARLDDGLSGEEQDAYVEWLAKDERHRKAISLFQWGWGELDRLAGLQTSHQSPANPKLLAPNRAESNISTWFVRKRIQIAAMGIAALLLLSFVSVLLFKNYSTENTEFQPAYELMERLVHKDLEDGSRVELNRGAVIRTRFTKTKRLILLEGGEANFTVAKDPNRPFVVSVGGLEVRAVGTVFNIKYVGHTVDVIVTEGKVEVDHEPLNKVQEAIQKAPPLLTAGQKATIEIENEFPSVTLETLDQEDIEAALIWQPRLLKYNAAPLSEIVNGFNRHNQIQVELGNPNLKNIVLTSAFWSDNVEGFVRLMENNFGVEAVWVDRYRIRLLDKKSPGSSL